MNTPQDGESSVKKCEEGRALEKHRQVSHAVARALEQEEPGHQLFTRELLAELLGNYSAEWDADPLILTKYFCAWSGEQFFVCCFDPVKGTLFGLRGYNEVEWSHFSLEKLLQMRGTAGIKVERNLNFQPTHASELIEGYECKKRF